MAFNRIKTLSKAVGLYRLARAVHLHILNRQKLREMKQETAYYSALIRPGMLCFDVGANYGAKSDIFLKLGAKVVAFEPQPDCFDELRQRIGSRNGFHAVNVAIASAPGRRVLYVDSFTPASSLVPGWQGEIVRTIEVDVTTLDDAIARFGVPQYCKIDVEGYELEVLRGLTHPIPLVSFEYHLRKDGLQEALECLNILGRFGATRVNISPAETPKFATASWQSMEAFKEFLQKTVPSMEGYAYGDIFVKLV